VSTIGILVKLAITVVAGAFLVLPLLGIAWAILYYVGGQITDSGRARRSRPMTVARAESLVHRSTRPIGGDRAWRRLTSRLGRDQAANDVIRSIAFQPWHPRRDAAAAAVAHKLSQRSEAALCRFAAKLADGPGVPDVVADMLWQRWLDDGGLLTWELLRNLGRPSNAETWRERSRVALPGIPAGQTDRDALFVALRVTGHPIGPIAWGKVIDAADPGLDTDVCIGVLHRPGLMEQDAEREAVFLLAAGRRDAYRDADPDATLFARAYRVADQRTRALLRAFIPGDRTLLGAVVAAGGRPWHELFGADRLGAFARELADAGNWPELWRFITERPILDAIDGAHLYQGPPPADPDGAALLRGLASVSLDLACAGGQDLEVPDIILRPIAELLRRPQQQMDATDLDRLELLRQVEARPGVRALVTALADCLDYRFGADIVLGSVRRSGSEGFAPDDIILSPGEAP
jgi:hypothetical protein